MLFAAYFMMQYKRWAVKVKKLEKVLQKEKEIK